MTEIADERDHFQAAMHRMRDAFLQMKQKAEDSGDGFGSLPDVNGDFFDGYDQAKKTFGDVLLRRDVQRADQ